LPTGDRSQRGFTYILLLLAIAIVGVVASSALSVGSAIGRRNAEQELLAIGLEFQQALRSYASVSGGGTVRGPRSLEELLKDARLPGVRRHLRQVYADPLSGRAEWGLVLDGQGFIVGVHSLSPGTPIQRHGFPPVLVGFEEAETYQQWVFGLPRMVSQAPRTEPSGITAASR
jgi:type II secretory pathway pseudopilin PulG